MKKGIIYLIPSVISVETATSVLPQQINTVVKNTKHFLAETIRASRRYVSSLKLDIDISTLHFEKVDKNTSDSETEKFLQVALQGYDIGVLSDAGCPGVADPGAQVARIAHRLNLKVVPLVGPSSLLLALMASGMNGQSFAFNGYLPIDQKAASLKIKQFEKTSRTNYQTQLFIETPYRSDRTFKILVDNLASDSQLCVAKDITGSKEFIKTMTVGIWKKQSFLIGKVPTVFLFLAS
jgi:16S rRNA (cytidine1402-2'-O)-methyltransferase